MPRLNFVPERDGWHFVNGFENRLLPGVVNISTEGLCGGMVMSALDYWRAGIPIPSHEPDDLPIDGRGCRLPGETSSLRRYIYDRQVDSLLTNLQFFQWITVGISPETFHNWAIGANFSVVQRQIGINRPAMLGLWSTTPGAPTQGHQVLCYGWDINPVRLYVYDPNNPDEETVLTPDSPARGCILRGANSGRESCYRGYFFTDVYNWNENPPYNPRYRDIVLTSGLNTTPTGPDANMGTPLSLAVTAQNVGEYRTRFRSFCIWARDPLGSNIDRAVGGIEPSFTSLNPGESRTIGRSFGSFGQMAGYHTIGVSKESLRGHWQNIAVSNRATANTRRLRLWPTRQKLPDTLITVPESSRTDIDTGVVLQPGDEFAMTGMGSIWAGVWFTGSNGPEGWTDRIETNPNFPLHNTSDSRPFSLLGRCDGEGYFYVGRGFGRRTFNGSSPRRLFLRINDNVPSNGSGAFQCLIEVWR